MNTSITTISNTFSIYPNPATHIIYIGNKKQEIINIYNTIGELVISTKEENIDVKNLPSGIYVIKKANETSQFIKK